MQLCQVEGVGEGVQEFDGGVQGGGVLGDCWKFALLIVITKLCHDNFQITTELFRLKEVLILGCFLNLWHEKSKCFVPLGTLILELSWVIQPYGLESLDESDLSKEVISNSITENGGEFVLVALNIGIFTCILLFGLLQGVLEQLEVSQGEKWPIKTKEAFESTYTNGKEIMIGSL